MRVYLLGLLVAVACSASAQNDNADINIYTDYRIGQWHLIGTADLDLLNIAYVRSHFFSTRVTLLPGTYFEIARGWEGQRTHGLSHIEMWLNGGPTGGHALKVWTRVSGNHMPSVPLSNYGTIAPNTWRRFRIPLADLGAANVNSLQRIYIMGTTPLAVAPFWVDDIKLLRPIETEPQTLTVNANNQIRVLGKPLFGAATFTWDREIPTQVTRDRAIEAGLTMLTFPGGTTGEEYDWRTNRSKRTGNQSFVDYKAFVAVANSIGAEKVITVNYGSGTPQEARDWVHDANIVNNSNVRYWSIGNEAYHSNYDLHPFQHDALTYAAFVRDAWIMMKAVDPTIKIGVSGTIAEHDYPQRVTVINPATGQPANGWGPVLLSKLRDYGITPDYWDFHWYTQTPDTEDDAHLLQFADRWTFLFSKMRQMLLDYLGPAGDNVPIYVLEANSTFGEVGKQATSIVNAIFLADTWAQAAVQNAGAFVWWNLRNPTATIGNIHPKLHGWRQYGSYGLLASGHPAEFSSPLNTPYPVFYAYKQVKNFARPGDVLVSTSSPHTLLSVYATRRPSTGRIRVMVINQARSITFPTEIRLTGNSGRPSWVYRYSMYEDENELDVTVTPYSTNRSVLRGTYPLTVPPYSITVIEFN